jgi:hypothetical protein
MARMRNRFDCVYGTDPMPFDEVLGASIKLGALKRAVEVNKY